MWVEFFSRVGVACRVEMLRKRVPVVRIGLEKKGACSENWVEILRKRESVVRYLDCVRNIECHYQILRVERSALYRCSKTL